MIEITRWLERQARRDRRRPSLEAALLSRSLWPYVVYRLRYFGLRLAARLAVHLVTFVLLYQAFSRPALVALVAAHALAALSISLWWGALETLRGRIRTLRADGQPHLIEAEITHWLSLSGRIAAGVCGVAVVWCVARAIGAGRLGPADLYQGVIVLRLALQIVTLTLHSGVFAIRRIYRPAWAIVAVELAGFAAAVAFRPIAGAWSLPLASLAAGLASSAIVAAYTLRAYRLIGIAGRSLIRSSIGQTLPAAVPWRESLLAGAANAAIKIDTLLVLAAFGLGTFDQRWPDLALLLYVLSPLVRAAQDWAQLLYFDLKRLEPDLLAGIRARYDRLVSVLAWGIGLSLWTVGGLLVVSVWQALPPATYLFLLPLFLIRSVLSMAQVRAFVAGRYGLALATAAVWIAATMLMLGDGYAWVKPLLAFGGPVLAWALPSRRLVSRARTSGRPAVLHAVGWLAQLGAVTDRSRVRAVQLEMRGGSGRDASRDATATWWATTRIAQRIARRLGDAGAATAIWPNRVAWHERGASATISREWLVRAGAGRLTDVLDTGVLHDGRRALEQAREAGLFGRRAIGASSDANARDVAEGLTRRFQRLCPSGVAYRTGASPPAWLDALPNRDKRRILSGAFAFARDFRPADRRSPYDVTVLAVDGAVRIVFVQDTRTDARRRGRWRALVRDANVAAATIARR